MIFFLFWCFSEFMCFIQITNSSEHLADISIYQYIYFSFMLKEHNICACVCPVLPTGDPVSSDQLEGSWPDHLRRAGAGRHLSCPAGQEHSQPLPLRTDAPHYQEERRALRLQDPHLCRFFLKKQNFIPLWRQEYSCCYYNYPKFWKSFCFISAVSVVAVLHPDAARQRQRSPALQCHTLQAPQAASHSAGEREHQQTDIIVCPYGPVFSFLFCMV